MLSQLQSLLIAAQDSKVKLFFLNALLQKLIPFNKPHRIKVLGISSECVSALIPYRRSNMNHIRGIHACGLATVSEFCSGLLLLRHINPTEYRLIMKSFSTEFFYQAKKDITASCRLTQDTLENTVLSPAGKKETFTINLIVDCHDTNQQLCSTTSVIWQLKPWKEVRTQ
ncbi:MAG: DUF4442 domain-containing protein [Bdellovibrionales bacterium]|nr:DUF4442 domain-containing protein [Bdellovibrionales bacterium]